MNTPAMSSHSTSEDITRKYADYYSGEDAEWRAIGARDKAGNIVSALGDASVSSVVEIGAGDGAVLAALEALDFASEYTAYEISESGVQEIQNQPLNKLRSAELFNGRQLPADDGTFDLAILSHVVEHLEHPRELIYEAARVARYVFVEVPLEHTWRLKADYIEDRVGHINFYTPRTIRQLCQSCHLRVLSQTNSLPSLDVHRFHAGVRGVVRYFVKRFALAVAPGIAPSAFTYHSSVLCESKADTAKRAA